MSYKWISKDVCYTFQGKRNFFAGDPIPDAVIKSMGEETEKEYIADGKLEKVKPEKAAKPAKPAKKSEKD